MKSIGLIFALIIIVLLSCSDNKREIELSLDDFQLSEEVSHEIVSSQEYQTYFNLRYEFLIYVDNAIRNGFSVSFLTDLSIKSIREQENEAIYKAIFNDYFEGESYIERLTDAKEALYWKFPVLNTIISEGAEELSKENVEKFYMNISQKEFSKTLLEKGMEVEDDGPVCGSYWQQVKLVACAGVCSFATAGIGTPLCGWACWCMLCNENSSLADVIC